MEAKYVHAVAANTRTNTALERNWCRAVQRHVHELLRSSDRNLSSGSIRAGRTPGQRSSARLLRATVHLARTAPASQSTRRQGGGGPVPSGRKGNANRLL